VTALTFTLEGLRTVSPNVQLRDARRAKIARTRAQRDRAYWETLAAVRRALRAAGALRLDLNDAFICSGFTITLIRIAPRELDSDNLAGSCKFVRDGVAKAIGIDDGSPRLIWQYAQRRDPERANRYAVEVRLEERGS